MHKKINIKENLLALGTAFVLVFMFFVFINNSQYFTADILKQQTTNQSMVDKGDIIYEIKNGQLDVYANKDISDLKSLAFYMIYDPTSIKIDKGLVNSTFDFSIANAGENRSNFVITNLKSMSKDQKIISMGLSSNSQDVTISDLVATFQNGGTEKMSIGKK